MNASIYRISLDIQDAHSGVLLDAKRGDTGRKLLISLTSGGFPYEISDECYAVFTATKPDGNIVFNPCEIDDNWISYDLTPQTVAAEGVVECEIKLYGADDMLITSACFGIMVNAAVYDEGDEIESDTEVEALTHLLSEAVVAVHETREITERAETALAELDESQKNLEQKVSDASASAESASSSESNAKASETAAAGSAMAALDYRTNAMNSSTAAAKSMSDAKTYADNAKASETNASSAETAAKKAAEDARGFASTIDTEQIDKKIAGRADNLYFDPEASLLYLTSEGQIIGDGVQVATTGGGGSGTLSYLIELKNLLESRVITVSEGTKVELRFSYESVDEDGVDDGPGIGKVIVNSATKHTFTAIQGENAVDVTPWLTSGSNTVKVQIENSENAKKTLSYTVTVASAYLTSDFDASIPFMGGIPFVYTPTGLSEKTVHFELDGKEIGSSVVTVSGRQQRYTIPTQSHGAHHLRVWFECEIEGATVTSNTLTFALICIEEGNTTPIIAVNTDVLGNVEQFANIVKKYRVYSPASMTSAITLEAGGEVVGNLTVDRTEQTWTYRPTEVGELVQTIRCGDEFVSWSQIVTKSSIHVEAETEALALHLSSYGRSNNEANPGVWESGNISCEFQNFNFVADGWVQDDDDNTVLRVTGDARLSIPYKMFSYDFRTTGKTIEFEMATREVLNYDAEVINCFSGGRGFTITAQQLQIKSLHSELGSRYKEDEHIRVSFVAEKRSGNRLLLCYINGIMSGAVQYPDGDDFSQANPVGITIGSNHCTTDLYNIRVYDNDLTRHQLLDNWIADTQNQDEKIARYLRNQIYDAYGRVVISQLPADLPYMVIRSTELPQFKDDKKICSGYFVDPVNQSRSFSFQNAQIDVQGTSSQYYYVKNYKIKFKGGFVLHDESTVAAYQLNENAVPVDTFTMKADVASSEGAFNVVLAMLYDDLCPFKTPAQVADPRVRQAIEGFPMVMFWDNGSTELKFLGKYNFNNDKGTEATFGFKPGDESWEILQNGTDRVGWHSADFSSGWETDFEGRYPDKNKDITKLQQLASWLVSTDTAQATGELLQGYQPYAAYDGQTYTRDTAEYRLAKFSAELSDWFVEDALIFYYLFTEIFLSIDQREKNAFPTYLKDLDRWIVLFYDADSSLGTDNKGNLAFDYYLEDIDYTEAGDPVYNGQNSVLWKNLRATRYDEIMAMYKDLRTRTENSISYESTIGRFEAHQGKWPEAIFNEDMYRKCIEPLVDSGDGLYLPMLQGKKEQWMKWWLYNRFRYLDSKYVTGTSQTNQIQIRAHQKANIHLKSYVNMYGHVYFNAAHVEHRMVRGQEYEFEWPASGAEDPVIGINDADLLTSLGDLSPLMVELIDVSVAPHITELKVGDGAESYTNYSLNSITLGNNKLLRKLDLRNCVNLTQNVDISGCSNIEEAYLDGTSVTGVSLPNGGILKKLHLPGTVADLTVLNQKNITEFVLPSYSNIENLRVENSPAIPVLDILNAMKPGDIVRIIGLDITADSMAEVEEFISKLDTMRGRDENGNIIQGENGNHAGCAQVSGRIYVDKVSYETLDRAKKYVGLKIEYGELINYVAGLVERTIAGEYSNGRLDEIGEHAAHGCTQLTEVSFPEVTEVKNGAFESCEKITAINFPKVVTLGDSAFFRCYALKEVYLPACTDIAPGNKTYGFGDCTNLAKVDLPVVSHIGNASFTGCRALETLILRNADKVCSISSTNVISATKIADGTGYIYVPKTMADGSDGVAAYQASTNWAAYSSKFRAIEDYPEICGGD